MLMICFAIACRIVKRDVGIETFILIGMYDFFLLLLILAGTFKYLGVD